MWDRQAITTMTHYWYQRVQELFYGTQNSPRKKKKKQILNPNSFPPNLWNQQGDLKFLKLV